jgi:hypothetical protein
MVMLARPGIVFVTIEFTVIISGLALPLKLGIEYTELALILDTKFDSA